MAGSLAASPIRAEPFDRDAAQRRALRRQLRGEQRRARRMRDARQRVERGFGRLALAVVLEQIGQRLDAALVAHRAERLHRRRLDRAVVVVQRRDHRVADRLVRSARPAARFANTRPMHADGRVPHAPDRTRR